MSSETPPNLKPDELEMWNLITSRILYPSGHMGRVTSLLKEVSDLRARILTEKPKEKVVEPPDSNTLLGTF